MDFRFKQFGIAHDRCAHKVGTDGVLLGAWADLMGGGRILDIGTGCGLIALMAAQRAMQAEVTGIDIDAQSVEQAQENVAASPFADRIRIVKADVRLYAASNPTAGQFHHILSNPPYHTEALLPPDARRAAARHTSGLTLTELIHHAACMLAPNGTLHLIIPAAAQSEVSAAAMAHSLHLTRLTLVRTTATKPPRRALMSWQRSDSPLPLHHSELVLTQPDGRRTPEHEMLTAEFYIR